MHPRSSSAKKTQNWEWRPSLFFNVTQISSVLFLVRRLRFSELLFAYRISPRGSAHPPSLRVLSLSVCIFDLLILFRVCTSSAVFSLLFLSRILWKSHGTAEGAILVHCCIVPPIFFVFLAMKSFTRRCGPCRSPGFASGV